MDSKANGEPSLIYLVVKLLLGVIQHELIANVFNQILKKTFSLH